MPRTELKPELATSVQDAPVVPVTLGTAWRWHHWRRYTYPGKEAPVVPVTLGIEIHWRRWRPRSIYTREGCPLWARLPRAQLKLVFISYWLRKTSLHFTHPLPGVSTIRVLTLIIARHYTSLSRGP